MVKIASLASYNYKFNQRKPMKENAHQLFDRRWRRNEQFSKLPTKELKNSIITEKGGIFLPENPSINSVKQSFWP